MLDRLRAVWATEPVRVTSVLVAIVVAAAGRAGIVLDPLAVHEVVALVLLVALGGEVARARVTPTQGPVGPPSDSLLPDPPDDAEPGS